MALSGPAQAATVYDDEIVPGQPTAYHAIVRSTGAQTLTSLSAASGEVTWSPERGHLSVPGDAVSGTLVSVHSFDVTTRPARQGKFLALGRAEPIIVSGTRQLREGALTVYTRTRADREAVEELLTANRVLLLRLPADVEGEPGDAVYLWVTGDLPVERVSRHRHGGRYLTVRWTEQTRPEVE